MAARASASGGAIAAGHPVTATVGADVLAAGGAAVDACVAAAAASWAAEPMVTAVGAGGFLTLHDAASGATEVLDSFVAVPGLGSERRDVASMVDVVLDFGTTTQLFRVGPASCAVPGLPAGLAEAHRRHGRLPWADLLQPAIRLAREGVPISPQHAGLHQLLDGLLRLRPESRAVFTPGGTTLGEGELVRNPDLATTLERVAANGAEELYTGETGRAIVRYLREQGGAITPEDLGSYRPLRRPPLELGYRDARLATNPPTASGGVLTAHTLALLDRLHVAADPWDVASLRRLIGALRATQAARTPEFERALYAGDAVALLLDPERVAAEARAVAERRESHEGEPEGAFGTTHISVVDAAGNAAAMTGSSGCGSGVVVPGTGVHLNNMLGETDLATEAVRLGPGDRLTSMMAPTLVFRAGADGAERVALALGSSGSERIRSALVQVVVHAVDHALPVGDAVALSRVHPHGDSVDCEGGVPAGVLDALVASGENVSRWPGLNGYFGGCQAVARDADGTLTAAADPRRGGAGLVVP